MPLEIKCESCLKRYRVDERFAGKRVKCRHCGAAIAVPGEIEPDQVANGAADSDSDVDEASESVSSFAGEPSPAKASLASVKPQRTGDADDDQAELPTDFGKALKMARSRSGVRRFRLLSYPGAATVDSILPWAIALLCLIPVLWKGINSALATTPPWVMFTMYGLTLLLFLILIVPVTTRGLRVAAQMLHFQLPQSPGWRMLSVCSVPFALASMFYWQLDGLSGLIFGLLVGLLLIGPLLLVMMQLHWVEALVAWMTSALFFAGSVAVSAGVLFVVGLIITASTTEPPVKAPKKVIAKPVTKPVITQPSADPVAHPPSDPPTVPSDVVKPATPLDPATQPIAVAPPVPDEGEPFKDVPALPNPVTDPKAKPEVKPPVIVRPTPLPPSEPPVTKPEQITVRPSPIVKVVKELASLGDIDELITSDVAGGAVVARKKNQDSDRLVTIDLTKGVAGGEVTFKRDAQAGDRYVATPSGDMAVRLASWPKLRAEPVPINSAHTAKAMSLNDANGVPTLLGVSANDQCLIGWQNNGQFAVEPFSMRTGLAQKGFRIPSLIENGSAISGDGKTLAVAAKIDGPAEVLLFDLSTGRFRKLPITALDAKWPLEPVALTFSPDSSRLAICFERDGGISVMSWSVATGKAYPDQTYVPGTLSIPARGAFKGRALDWAGDNNTWLLYGQFLLDAGSGALLGVLGIDQTIQQHVVDSKTVVLVSKLPSGANRVVQLELDPEVIAKLRPTPQK